VTVVDRLLAHRVALWRTFVGLGVLVAVYYWWILTSTGSAPVDVHFYWAASPDNLYPHPELLEHNGYNYSPAFELVVGWGRLLPFDVFAAIWRALLLATVIWLAGPFAFLVIFLPPVASEINAGNIQLLMAAAIVVGFRYPGAWAFILLTKLTPGIGLFWFVLRRQWRALAWALGITAVIVIVLVIAWPQRWVDYLRLLTAGTPPPVPPYNFSIWLRLPLAFAIVVLGAWRGWRWPVVVAATVALPLFYFLSPSMLVGVLPFLRTGVGRWLRGESISSIASTSLPAQANP
jgi:hypothetical protein